MIAKLLCPLSPLVLLFILPGVTFGQEPPFPAALAQYPQDLPVEFRRSILQSQKTTDETRRAMQQWSAKFMAPSVDSAEIAAQLQQRYSAALQSHGYDRAAAGDSQHYLVAEVAARVAQTYEDAFRAMLAKTRHDSFRFLVNRPFKSAKEREDFLDSYLSIDFQELAKSDPEALPINWEDGTILPGSEPRAVAVGIQRVNHLALVLPLIWGGFTYLEDKIDDMIQAEVNRQFFERHDWIQRELKLLRAEGKLGLIKLDEGIGELKQEMKQSFHDSYVLLEEIHQVQREHLEQSKEMAKTLNDIQDQQEATLKQVEQNTVELKKVGGLLRKDLALARENATSMGFVKMHFYGSGRMSTEEKLLWQEHRQLPIEESARQREMDHLKRTLVAEKVGKYLQVGSGALAGLEKLGVDPEIVRTGQEVVKRASQVNDLMKAAMSGNPLSIAGAVFGMLLGGPDPAELRHKEIMDEFAKVHKRLARIEQKLDELTDLTKKQHQEVMKRFDQVMDELLRNRELIWWMATEKKRLLIEAVSFAKKYGISSLNDPARSKAVIEGISSLRNSVVLVGRYEIDPTLSLSGPVRAGHDCVKKYESERINPASLVFNKLVPEQARPVEIAGLAGVKPGEKLELAFDGPLSPVAVLQYGDLVADFAPMRLRLKDAGDKYVACLDEILADRTSYADWPARREDSMSMYRQALYLVNVAIAQQGLLSGEGWLPRLAAKLDDPEVISLLKLNQYIRENLARHVVRESGVSEFAYQTFLTFDHPRYLQDAIQLGGRRFSISHPADNASGWNISLAPEVSTPLPDASAVFGGHVSRTVVYPQLSELRARLAAGLAELEAAPRDERENQVLWALISNRLPPPAAR